MTDDGQRNRHPSPSRWLAVVSVIAAAGGLAGLQLTPEVRSAVWQLAGRFHPAVVHFPVALIAVAAAFEWFDGRRRRFVPSRWSTRILALGVASSAVAALLGFADAETAGHQGTTAALLADHRALGIATVTAAVVAFWVGVRARRVPLPGRLRLYRGALGLAVLSSVVTGHLGACLVHGPESFDEAFDRVLVAAGARAPAPAPVARGGALVDFARDVQPILARRCYSCHAGTKPEAGLSLDREDGLRRGGKSGKAAVTPGDPQASELVARIESHDARYLMPPKGGALTREQVETLNAWVTQGARWSVADGANPGDHWHWAWRPPLRRNPPAVLAVDWPRNPVDAFILARLEREKVVPSPEADRATLLRRLSLDVIGLPPTVEEVDAFVADTHPSAYDRAVDRLLASPHFGERWARPWLDAARYADTHGYEKDDRRSMWPWRDWVISALNADQPFDQFTIDQLAGDLRPNPTVEQRIATGFHRNTMVNEEGGVDPEEFRVETVADRVATTATVWLGMTIGCARCHDHKSDPITQRDYYSLFALFNDDEADAVVHATGVRAAGAHVEVPIPATRAQFDRVSSDLARIEAKIAGVTPEVAAAQAEWERETRDALRPWSVLRPISAVSANGADVAVRPDGCLLVGGRNSERETLTVTCEGTGAPIAALRLEVFPDSSWNDDVGRADNANAVVSEITLQASSGDALAPMTVVATWADFEQQGFGGPAAWPIAAAVDGDPKTGWAFGPRTHEPHVAVLKIDGAPVVPVGSRLVVTLRQDYGERHTLRMFRLSQTADAGVDHAPVLPLAIGAAVVVPVTERTPAQARALHDHFAERTEILEDARRERSRLREALRPLVAARAAVLRKLPESRPTHIHVRGSFLDQGDAVAPGTPPLLGSLPDGPAADRLALARWLVDGKNPLTARVAMNRLWAQIFGRGLVESDDDFGVQGEAPTHPELLDWLATEFVRSGWSQKAMIRLLVTSSTYRQASTVRADLLERDPENRLLARAPRTRLEAETIRDVALSAAGLLSEKVGGPSVFPPQPEGVWTMIYSNDKWTESVGDDRHRRGIYTFWRRTAPYPSFTAFGAPSREISCTRRPRTNTPLQALTTLNDPAFVEAAGALARRAMTAGSEPADWIRTAFRACVARAPTEAEVRTLTALFDAERTAQASDAASAKRLLDAALAGATDRPADLAAMLVVANVLLNLDETLTKG